MSRGRTQTGGRAATEGVIPGRYALSVGDPGTPLPDDWRWTRLLDVARLETGHTPSRRKPEYWGGDIPWIGIKDARVHHGRDIYSTNEATNQRGIDNSAARVLPVDTVCLSRTASIGYITRTKRLMCTSQDFVNWVCDEAALTSRYLMYVLLAEVESLFRFAHGTSHQTIYFPEAKAFHAALPPIEEQRRIAAVLGALDDKIELNRRMSQTLEEMAKALFKSWFVDFDGDDTLVRSTRALNRAGILTIGDGYRAKRAELADEGLPFARAGNIKGGFHFEGAELLGWEGVERANHKVSQSGDVVFTSKGTVGRFAFVTRETRRFAYSPQLCFWRSDDVDALHPIFLYHWMRSPAFLRQVAAVKGQTDMADYVSLRDQRRMLITVPPVDAQAEIVASLAPLQNKISANVTQSRTLADLRDTLLPKLISGEIRVPEAEAAVEAVL